MRSYLAPEARPMTRYLPDTWRQLTSSPTWNCLCSLPNLSKLVVIIQFRKISRQSTQPELSISNLGASPSPGFRLT